MEGREAGREMGEVGGREGKIKTIKKREGERERYTGKERQRWLRRREGGKVREEGDKKERRKGLLRSEGTEYM